MITFSAAEMDLMRREAEEAERIRTGREPSYAEKRYEFSKECNAGNMWNTEKTRRWAVKIKKELAAKMRKERMGGR